MLAEHGLDVTRSFCFWPDFVPEPERLDEDVRRAVRRLPRRARRARDCSTIPTFIVGHMSGENWDPAWREGRDLYRDVWLVSQQAWFAAEIARRFGPHPAVVGWLVSNEMPLYGGPATSRRDHRLGAHRRRRRCARRARRSRSRSATARGASRCPAIDNGYSLRALAPLVDFVGPHSYPMQDDEVRQLLTPAFTCELAGELRQARRARGVRRQLRLRLRGERRRLLPAGAAHDAARRRARLARLEQLRLRRPPRRGSVPPPRLRAPLRAHRPQRAAEGAAAGDGVVLRARARARRRRAGSPSRATPRSSCPSTSSACCRSRAPRTGRTSATNLLQSYVAAREADLPVELVRERDGIPAERPPLPRARARSCSPRPASIACARSRTSGATVYLSYFAGSTREPARARGSRGSTRSSASATACATASSTRSSTTRSSSSSSRTSARSRPGTRLSFRVAGEPSARAYLPVELAGAEVVAVDGYGRPALLRHALGAGQTVLCTYPLEHMAARTPWANPESTWRIYSALATRGRRLEAASASTTRACSSGASGAAAPTRRLFVNCSGDSVSLEPSSTDGEQPAGDAWPLTLEPFGVARSRSPSAVLAGSGRDGHGTTLAVATLTKGGMIPSYGTTVADRVAEAAQVAIAHVRGRDRRNAVHQTRRNQRHVNP